LWSTLLLIFIIILFIKGGDYLKIKSVSLGGVSLPGVPRYLFAPKSDCIVICKVVLKLTWLLPPLLKVCALPLRLRPRPRPRPRRTALPFGELDVIKGKVCAIVQLQRRWVKSYGRCREK